MYMRVYHEVEKLCATPSPITPGTCSTLTESEYDGTNLLGKICHSHFIKNF